MYTLDKGLTWRSNLSKSQSYTHILIGNVTDKSRNTYKINLNKGSDKNGYGNNYVLQSTITKEKNGSSIPFEHPVVAELPINLYLDKKEKLYITTGGSFNDAGVYMGASISASAYIYITKVPVE